MATSKIFLDGTLSAANSTNSIASPESLPQVHWSVTEAALKVSMPSSSSPQRHSVAVDSSSTWDGANPQQSIIYPTFSTNNNSSISPQQPPTQEVTREMDDEAANSSDNVIPLLLHEIALHTHVRQRNHLRLFVKHFDDFLQYCEVSADEWEMLLIMLLSFMNRRGGLTPMQTSHNNEMSDICFTIWHKLFGNPSQVQFVAAHQALISLMSRVGCTTESYFARPSTALFEIPPMGVIAKPQTTQHDSPTQGGGVFGMQANPTAGVGVPRVIQLPPELEALGSESFPEPEIPSMVSPVCPITVDGGGNNSPFPVELRNIHPYFYTLHCLTPQSRGSLSEEEFLAMESWYKTEVITKIIGEGKQIMQVTETLQKNHLAGRTKYFSQPVLKAWEKLYPVGSSVSLSDFLRFVFPDVPERTILHRVAGHPLVEGMTGDQSQKILATAMQENGGVKFAETKAKEAAMTLRRLQAIEQCLPTATQTLSLLYDWYRAMDFRGLDCVSVEQIVASEVNVGNTWNEKFGLTSSDAEKTKEEEAQQGGKEGGSGVPMKKFLTFVDFIQVLFPNEELEDIKANLEQMLFQQTQKNEAQQRYLERDNASLEAQLRVLQLQSQAPASPAATKGSHAQAQNAPPPPFPTNVNAAGHLISCFTPSSLEAVQKVHLQLHQVYTALVHKQESKLRERRHYDVLLKKKNHLIALQEAYYNKVDRTEIPRVYTVAPPPKTAELFGFKFTPSVFHLTYFLESAEWRPLAIQVLRTLDHTGIVANYYLPNPSALHLYLPSVECWTQPGHVYRDFACCTKRPPAQTFWEGNQVIHVKTNIPKKSDIKYRFQFEGYNYGMNAPISTTMVGYAARMLEDVDKLEKYGWPDGFDHYTIVHKGKGIAKATQYFSREEEVPQDQEGRAHPSSFSSKKSSSSSFVTFKLESRSFANVGFSVSAWMVCHEFGEQFPVSVEFFHQNEDL